MTRTRAPFAPYRRKHRDSLLAAGSDRMRLTITADAPSINAPDAPTRPAMARIRALFAPYLGNRRDSS